MCVCVCVMVRRTIPDACGQYDRILEIENKDHTATADRARALPYAFAALCALPPSLSAAQDRALYYTICEWSEQSMRAPINGNWCGPVTFERHQRRRVLQCELRVCA